MNHALKQSNEAHSSQPKSSMTSVKSAPTAKILTPIVQTGRVDVSELDRLSGSALREALVARARELIPLLERNASAGEMNRRVAEENIEAIRAAGLLKIMVPRRFGGLEDRHADQA